MMIAYEDVGTAYGDAMRRLSYSATYPFAYVAELSDCPDDVRKELKEIDRNMALEDGGHAIENWREL